MNCLLVELQVTGNLNSDPLLGLCQCPLCQLDCGSREQLIAHVYQVWAGEPLAQQLAYWLAFASSSQRNLGLLLPGRVHSRFQNILETKWNMLGKLFWVPRQTPLKIKYHFFPKLLNAYSK